MLLKAFVFKKKKRKKKPISTVLLVIFCATLKMPKGLFVYKKCKEKSKRTENVKNLLCSAVLASSFVCLYLSM